MISIGIVNSANILTKEASHMAKEAEEKGEELTLRHRVRARIHDATTSRTAKMIGLSALAAPVLALLAVDLKKPGSTSRKLLGFTVSKLLSPLRKNDQEKVDITHKVEVVTDDEK
jgi:hypothetical protein